MSENPDQTPERTSKQGVPAHLPLLESLLTDHLDPGYQAAADRRAAGPAVKEASGSTGRRRAASYLVAGLVVIGLVLGFALRSTEANAPSAEKESTGLQGDISSAESQQSRLVASASVLAGQIRATQSALGAGGPLATVQALELQSGLIAVTGPGMTVVIDGSSGGAGAGVILDRDIQLLVNSLWSAGAEAIAVGGVRLQTTSAIRQAGSAILVDNRPVFWPITIDAIGNQSDLHVNFVGTTGFGRFSTFVQLYGIRFDVSTSGSISLPAAGGSDLRYASEIPTPTTTR